MSIPDPIFVRVSNDSDGWGGRVCRVLKTYSNGRKFVISRGETRNLHPSTLHEVAMNSHVSTVHGKCPINGNWDYYSVKIMSREFIKVEDVEDILNEVRGTENTQEKMAAAIKQKVGPLFDVSVSGRHSQNTETRVDL